MGRTAVLLLGALMAAGFSLSVSSAADMPQNWRTAQQASNGSYAGDPDGGRDPVCIDFSSPDAPCCAVLQQLSETQQIAFLLQHPHCRSSGGGGNNGGGGDNGGGGGNNGGGSGGNNGGGGGGDN